MLEFRYFCTYHFADIIRMYDRTSTQRDDQLAASLAANSTAAHNFNFREDLDLLLLLINQDHRQH